MRTYRALLHLYPRRFRREYGDDMVALLEDQLRDEHALRVVGRTALDLVISVPTRHLEARMQRSSSIVLVVIFGSIAIAADVFGGYVGPAIALVMFVCAAVTWRRSRPIEVRQDSRWRVVLLCGVGLLATLIVVTKMTGELPDGWWYVAMATMFASFGLIVTGVVLGIASRMPPRAA